MFHIRNKILVTCAPRVSSILAKEIENLDFTVERELKMGVELSGTLEDTIRLNMNLRTAHRVLYMIDSFRAKHPDHLYKRLKKIKWEEMIPEDGHFRVDSFVRNDFIKDTRYANLRVKDAVVDRIQELKGSRPDSGTDTSKTVLYLHWLDENAAIYFDTSGETIAKHGYRKMPFKAPMMESLAAATIFASGWNKETNFINPMCGSGTLAIEAALMACQTAPGLFRNNFGFMHIKGYKEEYFEPVFRLAELKEKDSIPGKIIASDINAEAIKAAKTNARAAGVDHLIEFVHCDFRETPVPEGGGVVMLNPEYGERLGELEELKDTYQAIGDFFKQKCAGYTGYIFTGNLDLAKRVGLKPKRRMEFYNARIDCRLLSYELYAGSKRNREGKGN
ncbi:THUMP domain-containing class I SAM-dependent RNA methyltransferase [Xanthovirga aplysinae]|uniref:THUMP domain-containing class I SAM-dependent RNA methyltransferase n=1 Tax=Xanthovirga aplysinae TaxID=2529853 RepID=UPI0031B5B5A6